MDSADARIFFCLSMVIVSDGVVSPPSLLEVATIPAMHTTTKMSKELDFNYSHSSITSNTALQMDNVSSVATSCCVLAKSYLQATMRR